MAQKCLKIFHVIALLSLHCRCSFGYETIFSVNCGGGDFTDSYGVTYKADINQEGFSSDVGTKGTFSGVNEKDVTLYQTERYSLSNIVYSADAPNDGTYLLILKFSEVWFQQVNGKVFDVKLNDHVLISNLDIYARVGFRSALDFAFIFTIKEKGKIMEIGGGKDSIDLEYSGQVKIELVKGLHDNPKVNAIALLQGSSSEISTFYTLLIHDQQARVKARLDEIRRALEIQKEQQKQTIPLEDESFIDIAKDLERFGSGPTFVLPQDSLALTDIIIVVSVIIGAIIPAIFFLRS